MGPIFRLVAGAGVIAAVWTTRSRVLAEAAAAHGEGTPVIWGLALSPHAFDAVCALLALAGAALAALGLRGLRGIRRKSP